MNADTLREAYWARERAEREHRTALAMLNSLEPGAPEWARAAVRAAFDRLADMESREQAILARLSGTKPGPALLAWRKGGGQ